MNSEEADDSRGRKRGTLVEWHDAKGFGWIEAGDRRWFAHINEFRSRRKRPARGDRLSFRRGRDSKGRPCAEDIRRFDESGSLGPWLLLGGLLVLPLASTFRLPIPLWVVPTWLALASMVAWSVYALDKRRAKAGEWRITEASLHGFELIGGWPGALLAQHYLRHKTRKPGFQVVFWLIVTLYQVAAILILLGRDRAEAIIEWIRSVGS